MLHESLKFPDKPITIIHHAANCDHAAPPGSLSALEKCLASKAAFIEIDVIPLADGSLALLHSQELEAQTDGRGKASQMKRGQIERLRYKLDGEVTDEKVGFLEAAIDLLAAYPKTRRLQLDLKPFAPLAPDFLHDFLAMIEPVVDRIQVTSVADWAIRSLAQSYPDLSLGFDPLLYIDLVEEEPRPQGIPPFRVGAYGLLDDHPLSSYRWGPFRDYFAARADALVAQAPRGCEWFIRAEILKMALDSGFDWIDFLHQQGSTVDGWTIDVTQTDQIELAQLLVEQGIDKLTTDSPSVLATYLDATLIY